MSRLSELYKNEIVPALMKKFSYKNIMQVPKIQKVVINVGAGESRENSKVITSVINDLSIITGQKPVVCTARKSVANFKVREGMKIGVKVTLRREKMYEFLDRLVNIALPRVRDFRGLSKKSFDGHGNYSFGIKEQIVFPEVAVSGIDNIHGMDITVVTNAKTDAHAAALLKSFDFPFYDYN